MIDKDGKNFRYLFSFKKIWYIAFTAFLKFTLGNWLKYKFNLKLENKSFKFPEPPYFVISNHIQFWDPFIISYFSKYPLFWIVSDDYFRSKTLASLLKLVGGIPKSKFVADRLATKRIFKAIKDGYCIGIFPEGNRNWGGTTGGIISSTANLIKYSKIPVVSFVLKGAYLSYPRWAKYTRKNVLQVEAKTILTSIQIENLSVQQIEKRVYDSIFFDENRWNEDYNFKFKGKKLAEKSELAIFICPVCKSFSSLVSQGDILQCKICNFSKNFLENGTLSSNFSKISEIYNFNIDKVNDITKNIHQWLKWQIEYLNKIINDKKNSNDTVNPIFIDEQMLLLKGKKFEKLQLLGEGKVLFFIDRLEFYLNGTAKKYLFYIKKMYGENVQQNDKFDFYYENGDIFRLFKPGKLISAFKYESTCRLIKEISPNV